MKLIFLTLIIGFASTTYAHPLLDEVALRHIGYGTQIEFTTSVNLPPVISVEGPSSERMINGEGIGYVKISRSCALSYVSRGADMVIKKGEKFTVTTAEQCYNVTASPFWKIRKMPLLWMCQREAELNLVSSQGNFLTVHCEAKDRYQHFTAKEFIDETGYKIILPDPDKL